MALPIHMCLSALLIVLRALGPSSSPARMLFSPLNLPVCRLNYSVRYNPHFGSIHNILLNDTNMTETLTLTVMDHNDRRKDTILGAASFELSLLAEDATRDGIVAKVLREGKECGELVFNL